MRAEENNREATDFVENDRGDACRRAPSITRNRGSRVCV